MLPRPCGSGAGETVLVGDGRGVVAECAVHRVGRDGIEVAIQSVREVPAARRHHAWCRRSPRVIAGIWRVELLTQTGVSGIVPWQSQRTVSDWRGKQETKRQRWQRVARAAAKQSRRAWIPQVHDYTTGLPNRPGAMLILHEEASDTLFDVELPAGPLSVVVGPEGGLSDQEVAGLIAGGGVCVRMGPEILRTSTAGAAACVWIRGLEMRDGS